jgi:hypothetical protein
MAAVGVMLVRSPERVVRFAPAHLLEPDYFALYSVSEGKENQMRKSFWALLAVLATALTVGVGAAFATSGAHFFSATGTVNDDGALVVSWDEAGLGQQLVNYTLTTDASATYACINGGGNHPKAANKESVNGPLSSPTFSRQAENGRVQASSPPLGPLPSTLVCPSGQTFVLACVSYTNIVLTDTTNNVSTDVPDVSRTFVPIKGCP